MSVWVVPAWFSAVRLAQTSSSRSTAVAPRPRIAITALFSAYLGWEVSGGNHNPALFATWLILIGELAGALGLLGAILVSPAPSDVRRWIGMLLDYSAMGGVMYLQGESASPLYAVYLWVTIGNGMRYGPHYLFSATALAAVSFAVMMRTTPYWLQNPYLSWGLLLLPLTPWTTALTMMALTFVIEVSLDAQRKLAQADAAQVREALAGRGFYLQMPQTLPGVGRAGD